LTEEREEKRTLGLIVLRGDAVVSMTIEGPPPPEGDDKLTPGGPGVGKAISRGQLPVPPVAGAPIGLAGPVRGVGGPVPGMMQPPGVPFARPPMPGKHPKYTQILTSTNGMTFEYFLLRMGRLFFENMWITFERVRVLVNNRNDAARHARIPAEGNAWDAPRDAAGITTRNDAPSSRATAPERLRIKTFHI
jgi:hypothetical protein